MEEITVRLVEWGTKDYEASLELRHRVFREPAGLSIFDEDLSHEVHDYHICAFLGSKVVGVLKISKEDSISHIKQVAVDEEVRGMNIGKKIMLFAEEISETMGCDRIILNARKYAEKFYEKLGYISEGEDFLDPSMTVGMIYIKMSKNIK